MNRFKVITSQQNNIVRRLIRLREKKEFRTTEQCALVQGIKTIRELQSRGIEFKSLIATSPRGTLPDSEITKEIKAQNYYTTDVNLTRRILGTASKPANLEVYAEIKLPNWKQVDFSSKNKLLVLDNINDPGNLGTLVRTAMAMDWDSGIITSGTCDLFNDKALRAARGLSLSWPHQYVPQHAVLEGLKKNGFTPVVADMLPPKLDEIWSPEHHHVVPSVGSGLWFWNFKETRELPKKVALVLCSEHHGVNESVFKDEIRVSLPMNPTVESLNVANAGSIIMNELNRYIIPKAYSS